MCCYAFLTYGFLFNYALSVFVPFLVVILLSSRRSCFFFLPVSFGGVLGTCRVQLIGYCTPFGFFISASVWRGARTGVLLSLIA